jgi:hypothetical protein
VTKPVYAVLPNFVWHGGRGVMQKLAVDADRALYGVLTEPKMVLTDGTEPCVVC